MAGNTSGSLFSSNSHQSTSFSLDDDSNAESTEDILKHLQEAWQNERFAPDLLPHKKQLVDWLSAHISQMEESISRLPKESIVSSVLLHELDRLKFVLNSYLRARLQKIETHAAFLLEQEASRPSQSPSKLTSSELVFAKEYSESVEAHLKSTVMQFMPPNFQNLDKKKTALRPNMDSYVFCKATEKIDDVVVSPEEESDDPTTVDFEEGSQHLVQYRLILPHLHNGAVRLL